MKTANAPLFKDPIHNGAADPVVIYNEETGEITVKKVFLTASAKIGDTKCTKNGTDYEIGAPFVSEGEIYLPIEFFEKIMDFKCEKNEDINFIRFVS